MQKIHTGSHHSFKGNTIPWIEKLLQTPIDDYRKKAVALILAPYLINIKKYLMMQHRISSVAGSANVVN
jgi:hypothetical protein